MHSQSNAKVIKLNVFACRTVIQFCEKLILFTDFLSSLNLKRGLPPLPGAEKNRQVLKEVSQKYFQHRVTEKQSCTEY